MRNLLFVSTLTLSMFNCSLDPKNTSTGVNHENSTFAMTQIISLFGEWNFCKKIERGTVTNYNQCPKIIFKDNKKGYYVDPYTEQITFNWDILSDSTLNISFAGNKSNENEVIKSGAYKMIFIEKPKYIELQLKSISNELIYFLAK